MSVATVIIPGSLYERVKQMAEKQHISVDQFVASAVAEKMAVVDNEGYLAMRASRADEKIFQESLAHIPDVAPAEHDKL